jgi:hypothetical protein
MHQYARLSGFFDEFLFCDGKAFMKRSFYGKKRAEDS